MLDVISYSKAKKVEEDLVAHKEEYMNNTIVMKNELVNSDFKNGTTGWAGVAGAVNALGEELIYKVVSLDNYARVNHNIVKFTKGNKYYLNLEIYPLYANFTAIQRDAVIGNFASGYTINDNEWNKITGIQEAVDTIETYLFIRHSTSTNYAIGDEIKYRRPLFIDLTKLFGKGKEPSKDEMDLLLKQIPNEWFDGELTLTQQQIANWQLALIRQNRNSIIELGGTI